MSKQQNPRWLWWFHPVFIVLFALGCKVHEPGITPKTYDPPLPNGGSVFFVGNSFFQWEDHNLPEWVAALGKARGLPFEVGGDIIPGDLILTDFLQHPVIKKALAERKYQIWVIQGHELEPIDHPREFRQAIRDFNKAIVAAGGSTVLFRTWEFRWRKILPEVADAYESIGQELHIPIIPAGLVYRDCDRAPPEGKKPFFLTASPEHPDGDLHENMLGTAVNAYATFSVLTGQNPLGQAFSAPGNTIKPDLLRYLSDHAWVRVAPRLRGARTETGTGH